MGTSLTSGRCLNSWRLVWTTVMLQMLFIDHGHSGSCMPPLQCIPADRCRVMLGNRINSYTLFLCGSGNQHVCCPPKQQPEVLTNKIQPSALMDKKALLPFDICGVSTENKIIGGKNATPGEFPWMALLGYKVLSSPGYQFLCGGSVINERYIITAAHCLRLELADLAIVRLGEVNLTSNPDCEVFNVGGGVLEQICADPFEDFPVESFKIHERFSSAHLKNDIAIIRLKRSISFKGEYIRPLCLPINLNISGNEEAKYKIAGWGKTDNYMVNGSTILQHATVQGVPRDDCNALQAQEVRPIDESQLCAGNTQGMDTCKGDSGGPLMHIQNSTGRMYLVGIVSFGSVPCGGRDAPSVYTRVAAFIDWILSNMEK